MITWLGFRHVKYGVRPHHIPIMGQVTRSHVDIELIIETEEQNGLHISNAPIRMPPHHSFQSTI